MDRILRTMRAGGEGVDSHHLASLTDSKYSVTRTAGVIGTYGFSRFFPQVNLRVEATSQPWFTCLFLQLRLPCCTIATKKTFRTTPRIRLDPNQRVYYRLETQFVQVAASRTGFISRIPLTINSPGEINNQLSLAMRSNLFKCPANRLF